MLIVGNGARVRNFGSVTTFGEPTDDFSFFCDAIAVYGDNHDITNWGTLETHGAFSSGIAGLGEDGRISNYGLVRSSGEGSPAIAAFGNGFSVDNWGELETEGDFAQGVLAFGDGGTIRNFGSIATSGSSAHGIVAAGDHNLIVNHGAISIAAPFTPAMDGFGSYNEVVNYGTIAGGYMYAGGSFANTGSVVSNWGTISFEGVDIALLAVGIDALAQNFGAIGAVAGGVGAVGGVGVKAINTGTIVTAGDLDAAFVSASGLIVQTGAGGEASNSGTIRTFGNGASGISFISSVGGEITNSGVIETFGGISASDGVAARGVAAAGMDVVVRNTRTGVIETHNADSAAVSLNESDIPALSYRPGVVAADTHGRLENDGVIRATQTAVSGGAGDETVVNRGLIVGDVVLNDGDDTFVFGAGGELDGNLFLGSGNDSVVVHRGAGTSRVADFAAGPASGDVIDVSAFFSNLGQLQDHSVQEGGDVVINLGGLDLLVLANVQLAALEAGDFLFADSAAGAVQSPFATLNEEPNDFIFG